MRHHALIHGVPVVVSSNLTAPTNKTKAWQPAEFVNFGSFQTNLKITLPPIPAKRFFTISEVSELSGVKPHILRAWEHDFTMLAPQRRRGLRRYYQHHEVLLVRRIRELLYDEGLTVDGALQRFDAMLSEARRQAHPAFEVELVGLGNTLSAALRSTPSLVHELTPEQFEEFVCERLFSMGLEPLKVGATNRKDGGIDLLFWPRQRRAFPFLGAAQVKHHRDPNLKQGPAAVREFAGAVAGHPFNAGLIVTNTTFSPDAQWFAREHARLIRLRDFNDIKRWLLDDFNDEAEWREIPETIELCPGVVIKIR